MSRSILSIYKAAELSARLREQIVRRESIQDTSVHDTVASILAAVRDTGAQAVLNFTRQFDGVEVTELLSSRSEFDQAEAALPADLRAAFNAAAANIRAFHELQRAGLKDAELTLGGTRLGFRYQAVDCAAVYVPGGKARYPSSVLMGLIPANVAGVRDCMLVTPPTANGSVDPAVLYCARLAGCETVIKSGGAQGIAAAAFGLGGRRPDLVIGPGNRFVTEAKQQLAGQGLLRIDSPAGPSEVLVVADDSANPEWVAADMLSQAEHGADSPAILACLDLEFAQAVNQALDRGLAERPARAEWKRTSIQEHSCAIVFESKQEALDFANEYAAEHLEICTRDPEGDFQQIRHAGSVFLGHYAPVALGDYYSGTNHVLPTGGTARFYAGLGVDSFLKRMSWQYATRESLAASRKGIALMSAYEGFDQEHGHSVEVRFQDAT
ncbi:MAG: histidinol dehydrogenase [Leptospiraceae bacterium]|nr:histidinol dehydrogenase [Leptospiraceae bacterium]